jgi:hypothetical protein
VRLEIGGVRLSYAEKAHLMIKRIMRTIVKYADMTAQYEHVDEAAAVNNLEKIIFDVESLFLDPKVGHWMVYRAMRANGIYVTLDGSGAEGLTTELASAFCASSNYFSSMRSGGHNCLSHFARYVPEFGIFLCTYDD